MTIPILYEDDDLLIIDKTAGIIVNKSETTINQTTIQEWAETKFKVQSSPFGKLRTSKFKVDQESDFYKRGGIVHRLDKETSGVLIIAKNLPSFENVQKQFKDRVVKKTYIALAHGKIVPEIGEIDVPIGRLPWNRKQFGIIPDGRESKTLYKVKKHYQDPATKEKLSLVELYPLSGRTHQIRVHLKYIGHPIFSDFLYAGRKTSKKDRKKLSRVFLHAAKISFLHPTTERMVTFESSLPPTLEEFLKTVILKDI